jgi:GTP-binding protein
VPTAALNRWFEQAVDANPPPAVSGRRLKLNYITQAKARPPSFFCSARAPTRAAILSALSHQQPARGLRSAGHADRITLREKANPFAHKRKRPS